MTAPLADAEARRLILEALDQTLVVEAAAGTGKTTALVSRMVALLESGRAELPQMVALTFTEKAAGEMKLRLRSALEARRLRTPATSPAAARLQGALSALETAQVGTIHGFCSDLLQRRPVEAGVDPAFKVGGGDEAQGLLERVFDRYLQLQLEAPPEGIRRALRRERERGSIVEELRRAAATLVEQRDFDQPWARPSFDRPQVLDDAYGLLEGLARLRERAATESDPLARDLAVVSEFVEELRESERALGARDYDALEAGLCQLQRRYIWRRKGSGPFFGKELRRRDVLDQRDHAYGQLTACVQLMEADLAAALHRDLQDFVTMYEREKRDSGTLDYLDLLICVRDLLRDDIAVRHELQAQYTHVFLDEFQDIDPLQAEILACLCCDSPSLHFGASDGPRVPAGKLFVVGDPKQAIYRFRRADVSLYERIKASLAGDGASVVQLTTSFRALPDIQSLVNSGFSRHMTDRPGAAQARYYPLSAFRAQPAAGASVIALPIQGDPRAYGRSARSAIARQTADTVAAFIERLLAAPEGVLPQRDAPLRPQDLCLLFRRFRSFGQEATTPYLSALTAREIPHVLIGGRAFHQREEILCLRTVLQAIEWPDDELQVYAALHGPLIALRDEALFAYQQSCGPLGAFAMAMHAPATADDGHDEVRSALALLQRLHLQRNARPICETLQAFLSETRAHAGLALWPRGDQVLSNVARLIDLARRFEREEGGSLRAFCDWLERSAERGEGRDASPSEEHSEGVRLMTVHNAKGLEFPLVILCDPTVPRESTFPSRYLDHERHLWACNLLGCQPYELRRHAETILAEDDAEEVRIAYVAATRARDVLVVPVGASEPIVGWLDVLHPGLYPAQGARARPLSPPPAAARASSPAFAEQEGPAAGYHRPAHGDHRVLFWDTDTLTPAPVGGAGLRQQQLLIEDPHGNGERGLRAFEAFVAARDQTLERGARPSCRATPITHLSAAPWLLAGPSIVVTPLQLPVLRTQRPRGARFGTLVHAVLADSGFDDDPDHLLGLSRLHGRLLGADAAEIEAAARAAQTGLEHPLLREAGASPEARFEVPVGVWLGGEEIAEDGVAEGMIDLLFTSERPGQPYVVVDFKTDAVDDEPSYRRQVALYAQAVQRATERPVLAFLLGL